MSRSKIIWQCGNFYVEESVGRWYLRHPRFDTRMAELIYPKRSDSPEAWVRKKLAERVKTVTSEIANRQRQVDEAKDKLRGWADLEKALAAKEQK